MSTFAEITKEFEGAKNKKAVLIHLVEYIDANFRANAGADPKLTLKKDDNTPVPQDAFEAVITEILTAELEQIEARLTQIQSSVVTQPPQSN